MSTPKDTRKRPRHPDARFELCAECGKRWNVSIGAEIPPSGYLCPRCRNKYIKTETEKRSKQ